MLDDRAVVWICPNTGPLVIIPDSKNDDGELKVDLKARSDLLLNLLSADRAQ